MRHFQFNPDFHDHNHNHKRAHHTMPYAALRELTRSAGLADPDPSRFVITGTDPLLRTPYKLGTAGAASIASLGVAVADLWALRTGRQMSASVDMRSAMAAMRAGRHLLVNGAPLPEVVDPISGYYRVKNDRWIFLHCNFPHHRAAAVRVLGAANNRESVTEKLRAWEGEKLETALMDAGGCGAYVRTASEWQAHPHYAYVAASPILEIVKIGEAPPEPFDKHGTRPLQGIRVIDMTRVIAGPTCGRTLAEHGAQVLKITRADLPSSGVLEIESGFGKYAADLDLRDPKQNETLKNLLRQADVFSQGYRPGTLAAKGFGPQELAELRPGIICTSLCAWGYEGPWRNRRGYDTVVQSATGMGHLTGDENSPRLQPVSAIDYIAGWTMAFGTMVALGRRAREGGSWMVKVSLAAAGQWLVGRGTFPTSEISGLPMEPSEEEIARMTMQTDSVIGRLTHLGPTIKLSETVPGWSRAPVPLGSDPPAWPQ